MIRYLNSALVVQPTPLKKSGYRNKASLTIFDGIFKGRLIIHFFRDTIQRLSPQYHGLLSVRHIKRNKAPLKQLEIFGITGSDDRSGQIVKTIFMIAVEAIFFEAV